MNFKLEILFLKLFGIHLYFFKGCVLSLLASPSRVINSFYEFSTNFFFFYLNK